MLYGVSLDVTVLMVTHDLSYALELCPRAVLLDDGVVVAAKAIGGRGETWTGAGRRRDVSDRWR